MVHLISPRNNRPEHLPSKIPEYDQSCISIPSQTSVSNARFWSPAVSPACNLPPVTQRKLATIPYSVPKLQRSKSTVQHTSSQSMAVSPVVLQSDHVRSLWHQSPLPDIICQSSDSAHFVAGGPGTERFDSELTQPPKTATVPPLLPTPSSALTPSPNPRRDSLVRLGDITPFPDHQMAEFNRCVRRESMSYEH